MPNLENTLINTLKTKSDWVRLSTLEMVINAGSGHLGGSFSVADILVSLLYNPELNFFEGEDKESERVDGGLSIHYIMGMNILVGIHLFSTENISLVTQTTDWAANTATAGTTAAGTVYATGYNAALGGAGTALGAIKSSASINFLDVGYFYDMADIVGGMSVSGGLGLP